MFGIRFWPQNLRLVLHYFYNTSYNVNQSHRSLRHYSNDDMRDLIGSNQQRVEVGFEPTTLRIPASRTPKLSHGFVTTLATLTIFSPSWLSRQSVSLII